MTLEHRDWDSKFFGYPVASASFRATPSLLDIQTVLREARCGKIRLLYLFLPPIAASFRTAIEHAGARSVGQKVEYAKPVGGPAATTFGKHIAPCRDNSPRLEHLALQSGTHSRFFLDPGFQQREFERLYWEWLTASLRGDDGKQVYVAGSAAEPLGLVTVEPGPVARIGLLAVDAAQRGHGLGHQLMAAAEYFCVQRHIAELHVATQASNRGACHFYDTCGFTRISEIDIFHVWFTP
ncbi:MAG: GNAT family N-acetyltransferase [Kiritimatiellia bacterium]|jgi:dTDP-4-amino-4,6-dideoxy-D-galactose acyltransferase|nr:GNAT family N-acetyltransferase [Kiritimatiellia bacterium]